jgi:hypothetical protein
MRPLLFGTCSTQELRIVCEQIARAFGATRSQRAHLCYPGICVSPAQQKTETPPASTRKTRAKLSEPWGALAILALIVLGAVVVMTSGNLLADNLIKRLQIAEQQRIDEGWEIWEHHFRPGHLYKLKLPDGRTMQMLFKGTVPTKDALPKDGNRIGDLWNIAGEQSSWVWTAPAGGSVLTWVDP